MDNFGSETLIILLGVILFLGLMVVVIWRSLQQARQRTQDLTQLATEMGYAFKPEEAKALLMRLQERDGLEIFRRGHSQRIKNLMRGRRPDGETLVFDYEYTTGGGKSRNLHQQTLLLYHLQQAFFTAFQLRPVNFGDKLAAYLGKVSIQFENRPEFAQRYHLSSPDPIAVQRMFSDPVLTQVLLQEKLCAQGSGELLAIWRQGKRVPAEEMRSFLMDGERLLNYLVKR